MLPRLLCVLVLAAMALPLIAQSSGQSGDGLPDRIEGRPNLTGVWQYIGEANWNLEPHSPGPGVVGELIPYLPEARVKRDENFANRRTEGPEAKSYMPGMPVTVTERYTPAGPNLIRYQATIEDLAVFGEPLDPPAAVVPAHGGQCATA